MESVISGAQTIYFQNSCHILGVSILIWDHLITLGEEWRFIWCRGKSMSAYWFLALRYGALAVNIPVLVFSFVTLPHKVCTQYTLAHQVFMLITQLAVSGIMILRIYALYARNARVLWWLIGIASCFIGITAWSMQQGEKGFDIPVLQGCHLGIIQSASYHLAASWSCLFVFDTIIFGLTVYNASQTRRRVGQHANMPIHKVIVRDGAMYFGGMALANLTNIMTFFVGGVSPPIARSPRAADSPQSRFPGSLATFATCISVTLMARLMLNLHQRAEYGVLTGLNMADLQDEIDAVVGVVGDELVADATPMLPVARV
ncbi:hypothetical protein C8R46DRAFT_484762 [Mycena filopes]|nr:hypothetical protein C8R46DRAFT_484762 [Mycena filopes]